MPKYNLALTPVSKGDEVVKYARQLSTLADKYLLGEQSLPHITLYQFEAEEEIIEGVWKRVEEAWEEKLIDLEFKEFSCVSFDKTIFWVSLLPNKCEELHKMHGVIAKLLDKPIKEKFDPHMTLLSTKSEGYESEVSIIKTFYQPMSDVFVLSLGSSDDIGQLKRIIFKK